MATIEASIELMRKEEGEEPISVPRKRPLTSESNKSKCDGGLKWIGAVYDPSLPDPAHERKFAAFWMAKAKAAVEDQTGSTLHQLQQNYSKPFNLCFRISRENDSFLHFLSSLRQTENFCAIAIEIRRSVGFCRQGDD